MKIIEALKKLKDLARKADDLKDKVQKHCADLDCESPIYPDQKRQVSEWTQAHSDIVKEILTLRYAIQKTNIMTNVSIELDGKHVTKTIAEWIHRRKDLAKMEESLWQSLSDRGLRDSSYQVTKESPLTQIKRRLYFDPLERDRKREIFRSEPSKIDSTLEIINATTELLEK